MGNGAAFAALASAVVRQATTFVGICDALLRPCFVNAFGREMVGLSLKADVFRYEIGDFFTPDHRAIIDTATFSRIFRKATGAAPGAYRSQ